MVDFKEGKIYRLVCNTTGQQYIGSTTQILSQRLGGHKSQYKRFVEGKSTIQVTSFNILSKNNFEMILIEEYPCENKNQLERRERHFIETMECVNKVKPSQTKEELIEWHKQYYQDNIEQIKERLKQYRYDNKEELNEKNKQYYQDNIEQIKERLKQYRYDNKEELNEYQKQHYHEYKVQKKQYRQKNKEKINEYSQTYRQENKGKITALIKCECGGQYQYKSKSQHFKTHKHKNWVSTTEAI